MPEEPDFDGTGRQTWLAIGVATLVAAGGVGGYFAWQSHQTAAELEAMTLPSPRISEPEVAPPKPPERQRPAATQPALAVADVPALTFAEGTTARVTAVEATTAEAITRGGLGFGGRPGAISNDPSQRHVVVTIEFADAQPSEERAHLVRINGQPMDARFGGGTTGGDRRARMELPLSLDADVDRITIEIAAAVGPFVESQRIAPGDAAASRNPEAAPPPFWIAALRSRPEATLVVCDDAATGWRQNDDLCWLLQAVLHDGRRLNANSDQRGSFVGHRVSLPAPTKDIAYVSYRYRPYTWRTVADVALPSAPTTAPADGDLNLETPR